MFPEDPDVSEETEAQADLAEDAVQDEQPIEELTSEEPGDEIVVAVAEPDTLTQIEERILRAVELVNKLRQERDAALRELDTVREDLQQTEASGRTLGEEILSLKADRQKVRGRLERLLGHIDQLS